MIRIETERLLIREHKTDDIDDYHACVSDPEVMSFILGFKQTASLEESRAKLTEAIESSSENPRVKFFLAVTLKKASRYIGSVGGTITQSERNGGIMDIGYFLNKHHWNQGYATEATLAWVDYVFNSTIIHKIFACCNSENIASAKVMQKCGMEKESVLKQHRYQGGQWCDELQYAVMKKDWSK